MIKLNKTIKIKMALKAVEINGVDADMLIIRKRRVKLVEDIRLDSLGGLKNSELLQSKIDEINDMIKDPLIAKHFARNCFTPYDSDNELYGVNLAGMQITLQFNGDELEHQTERGERVIKKFGKLKSYAAGHRFVEEFLSIEDDNTKLKARKHDLYETVLATLTPYRTVKKLLEEWPESKALLPDEELSINLPSIQVKDLNCLIGLPL